LAPAVAAAVDTRAGSEAALVSGKVVEKLDGGGYTYFLLEKDGKKTWVAVPPTEAKVGDTLSFPPGVEMKAFKSKTLDRTFDSIIFTDAMPKGGVQAPAKSMSREGHGQASAPVDQAGKAADLKVAKADVPNGYTVVELYSKI
jgi:hypothetical protein